MAFKNLEQRFNEKVNDLYAGATNKFKGGKPSTGKTDNPLIVRRPGEGYWGAMESRATPVRSAREDVRRLTLFQLSADGIKFLAKQQLLQTGNTFKFTRIINPPFIVANAVPFLHIKRNLRPLSELRGKTDTSYNNVRKMGTMQTESYNKLKNWKPQTFITSHINPNRNIGVSALKNFAVGILKKSVANKLSQAFSPVIDTISALNPALKRNVGEEKNWSQNRPELANDSIVQQVEAANLNYQNKLAEYLGTTIDKIPYVKYFNSSQGIKLSSDSSTAGTNAGDLVWSVTAKRSNEKFKNSVLPDTSTKKISYIKDDANDVSLRVINEQVKLPPAYTTINSSFEDPITISFAMGNDEAVKFRAFIKDFTETSNPQYQAFQYIGRIEKFINYTGVQREISFKLALVAFSSDELDMVWKRINYLTGMTFPYGFTKGLLQPNIIRLTIGGVYTDQPGYITALNTNFSEPTETWDIDRDVPIAATMDIRFTLIEKATRVADSPFYGITDGDGRDSKTPMPGFRKQIYIPPQLQTPTEAPVANQPTAAPTVSNKETPPTNNPISTKISRKKLPSTAHINPSAQRKVKPNTQLSADPFNENTNTSQAAGLTELNTARFGVAWNRYQSAIRPSSIFGNIISK